MSLGRYAYQRKTKIVPSINEQKSFFTTHSYGWSRDLPDQRDHQYLPLAIELPQVVDLRDQLPAPYDQLALGSCTANAIAAALQCDQMKQHLSMEMPSRLFIYYNERAMENTIASDAGAMIRDGIKSVASIGVCSESLWPYDITQFACKPSDVCYQDGLKHLAISYKSIDQNLLAMQTCLAEGYPFVAGITVYESFESVAVAQTGVIPMPAPQEQALGGHAILICGYSNEKQMFYGRNSWSASWGDKGYFYLPYAYLLSADLADDFWTIRVIE